MSGAGLSRTFVSLTAVWLLFAGSGCGQPAPPTPTATAVPASTPTVTLEPLVALFPFVVTDSRGEQVTFDEPAERIVVIDNAALDALFAIGEGDRVVATHAFASYPPEVADIPKVSDGFNINVEAVVELEPDLVFVFFENFAADLEKTGLKVLYLQSLANDFEKTTDLIRMWGRITGSVEAADAEAERFEVRLRKIRAAMDGIEGGLKVFQDVGGFWTPGPDTLVGEVFELLKLENIAHDVSGYEQISPELIVERDPDVIIASDPESITGNDALKDITAVKEGHVIKLPSDALSNAGPRFVAGIEELAEILYPDEFGAP